MSLYVGQTCEQIATLLLSIAGISVATITVV